MNLHHAICGLVDRYLATPNVANLDTVTGAQLFLMPLRLLSSFTRRSKSTKYSAASFRMVSTCSDVHVIARTTDPIRFTDSICCQFLHGVHLPSTVGISINKPPVIASRYVDVREMLSDSPIPTQRARKRAKHFEFLSYSATHMCTRHDVVRSVACVYRRKQILRRRRLDFFVDKFVQLSSTQSTFTRHTAGLVLVTMGAVQHGVCVCESVNIRVVIFVCRCSLITSL